MFLDLMDKNIQPVAINIENESVEILLTDSLAQKLQNMLEREEKGYAKVYSATSVVKPDRNYVFFSNYWYYLATTCKKYAEALYPYCEFFDRKIRIDSEMTRPLANGDYDNADFVNLFENDIDRERMIAFIQGGTEFRPGKALLNLRDNGNIAARSCKDIFGSCVLKKILVPDASSGYLGNLIYYLAKNGKLFDELEAEVSDVLKTKNNTAIVTSGYDIMNHNLYGIHMKNINDAFSDDNPHICIGWSALGDLSKVQHKEDLGALYDLYYKNKTIRAKGQDVGQIWRFKEELKIGDYVFFADGAVCHIGKVVSDYYYDTNERESQYPDYKNSRTVEWLKKDIDRKNLSDALHYCLGTAMSIWSMNDYKSVALELLNGTYKKDDSETGDYLDAEDQEEEFRTWMSAIPKNSSGELYSAGTVATYIRCMKKGYRKFDSYRGYASVFDIQNINELDEYKSYLFKTEGFDEFEEKNGNRACSNGIAKYREFLDKDNYHFFQETEYQIAENTELNYSADDEYTKGDFLAEVFMDEDRYDTLVRLLEHKRNVILQGAPGVGKTFLAKRLAYSIMGYKKKSHVEMIQFHQNYSYEDFIMGYKPNSDGFELKSGVFYNFCKKAAADKTEESKYFFIIDEINRGNLSKIFGELMMLVEGDKRGEKIKLAYKDEMFGVPENVYIIGMMNTADRSLAIMDYALRRRFSFFDVEPAFDKHSFRIELEKNVKSKSVVNRVIRYMTELNKKIADEEKSGLGKGFCIGHSYFCVPPIEGETDEQWYDSIVEYEIAPLLEEYWWDDKDTADDCINDLKKK